MLLAEALAGAGELCHIKVEDGPGRRLGRSFQVKLWPTLVFLADGRIVDEMADPTAERVLDRMKRFDVEGSPAPAPVT